MKKLNEKDRKKLEECVYKDTLHGLLLIVVMQMSNNVRGFNKIIIEFLEGTKSDFKIKFNKMDREINLEIDEKHLLSDMKDTTISVVDKLINDIRSYTKNGNEVKNEDV